MNTQNIPLDYNLIDSKTPIRMDDDNYVRISNISIGDKLYNNNTVVGVIYHFVNDLECIYIDNIMYGFSNIVYYNDAWINVKFLENTESVTKYSGVMYNLITTKGYYQTNKFIVRDYLELHSVKIYDDVRSLTLRVLNKKNKYTVDNN
jgi:hypothetical protein